MLDLKFITENPDLVKAGAKKKHVKVDIDKIVNLYNERKSHLQKIESLRARQNEVSKQIPKAEENEKKSLLEEMGKVKEEIKSLEPQLEKLNKELKELFH